MPLTSAVATNASSISRQKYWKELNLEEKIERMRDVVKMIQSRNENISDQFSRVKNDFERHIHLDKEIVFKKEQAGSFGILSSKSLSQELKNDDECYF